jgi:hypothetical protein
VIEDENSDDQQSDDGEPRGNTSGGREHLPAVALWTIDAGSATGGNQSRVEFC